MIDCHTHLTHPEFDADRAAVLRRAWAVGVTHVAIVGQDGDENEAVLRLARSGAGPAAPAQGVARTPDYGSGAGQPTGPATDIAWLPFLGLHPDRFADRAPPLPEAQVSRVCEQVRAHRGQIVGIGEVGLDYWLCQDEGRRALQRAAFSRLIDLALELDLPLNVHSRSAGHHTLDLLRERGARRVLMHAFDGKAGHALRGAEAGYVFSIPPSIVRSPQKAKLAAALPLQALALETDSPVLGPQPGQRNEPANLALCVQALASIKQVPEEHIRLSTVRTTRALFGLAG